MRIRCALSSSSSAMSRRFAHPGCPGRLGNLPPPPAISRTLRDTCQDPHAVGAGESDGCCTFVEQTDRIRRGHIRQLREVVGRPTAQYSQLRRHKRRIHGPVETAPLRTPSSVVLSTASVSERPFSDPRPLCAALGPLPDGRGTDRYVATWTMRISLPFRLSGCIRVRRRSRLNWYHPLRLRHTHPRRVDLGFDRHAPDASFLRYRPHPRQRWRLGLRS